MINLTSVFTVLFLVFLEIILSVDNSLVLALAVRHLPHKDQRRALTFGIWGAFLFRYIALFFLTDLMRIWWLRPSAGCYLLCIAFNHYIYREKTTKNVANSFKLWRTILFVEFLNISFSADSILASLSISNNYWIILIGAMIGIVLLRFSSTIFIDLIDRFPRLERTAYLLISVIGFKFIFEGLESNAIDFYSSHNFAFWLFWIGIAGSIISGFKSSISQPASSSA